MINIQNAIVKCSQGNPGALNVLCELAKTPDDDSFMMRLLIALELTGTKAPNIWIVYKDLCKFDLQKTKDTLLEWFDNSSLPLGDWLKVNKGVEYAY